MQVGESNPCIGYRIDVSVRPTRIIAQFKHFGIRIIEVDQDDIGTLGEAVLVETV